MTEKEQFIKNGYTVVRNAVSKELIDFVTQYALFDEMQDFTDESNKGNQVPNAHSKYADPAMEAILLMVQPIIEKNTGLSLSPTYSYYRVYRNGNELKHHIDRPACEISCTLAFNYSYDDSKYRWPIFVGKEPIYLYPGDLAIYRGMELDHWREPLEYEESVWQVQAFLHYVDNNGPNAEWAFDKRPSIGFMEKSNSNIQYNQKDVQQNVVERSPNTKSYIKFL